MCFALRAGSRNVLLVIRCTGLGPKVQWGWIWVKQGGEEKNRAGRLWEGMDLLVMVRAGSYSPFLQPLCSLSLLRHEPAKDLAQVQED